MAEYGGAAKGHSAHVKSPISVPWIVVASVLCGVGITLVWWWLETFQWVFFSGVLVTFVGAMMFLNDRAGLDHA
ncbi:MAG: hypothetical protein WBF81_02070 [Thermoplasmata archaeon]